MRVGVRLCTHVQLCVLSVCATAGQITAFVFPVQEKDSWACCSDLQPCLFSLMAFISPGNSADAVLNSSNFFKSSSPLRPAEPCLICHISWVDVSGPVLATVLCWCHVLYIVSLAAGWTAGQTTADWALTAGGWLGYCLLSMSKCFQELLRYFLTVETCPRL